MIAVALIALSVLCVGLTVIVLAQGEHLKGHDRVLGEMRQTLIIHQRHLGIHDNRLSGRPYPYNQNSGNSGMARPH